MLFLMVWEVKVKNSIPFPQTWLCNFQAKVVLGDDKDLMASSIFQDPSAESYPIGASPQER
jgi:hypothetical protein